MEVFRRSVAFLVGVYIVAIGLTDTCPRVGDVIIGLLLMGIITIPEAFRIFSLGKEGKDEP
jgi:hypothetical protein